MAQILLYGGFLILAAAIVSVLFRQVGNAFFGDGKLLSSKGAQPPSSHDFRPRDSSGKVMETIQRAAMPVNSKHPSHSYRKEVETNLRSVGGDVGKLFLPERNFMLAYQFEEHLSGDGLIGFLLGFPKRELWEQAKDALFIVRADEYGRVFTKFLGNDGTRADEALAAGKLADFRFSEDWDAVLIGSRTGANEAEKATYMERRLDFYCDEGDE